MIVALLSPSWSSNGSRLIFVSNGIEIGYISYVSTSAMEDATIESETVVDFYVRVVDEASAEKSVSSLTRKDGSYSIDTLVVSTGSGFSTCS